MKLKDVLLIEGYELTAITSKWSNLGIKSFVGLSNNIITVSKIIVPEDARNSGTGTKAMKILTDYADKNNHTIALTPSSDFGGNKNKLIEFYKRFGFVLNKGRNKDYEISETMYRISR